MVLGKSIQGCCALWLKELSVAKAEGQQDVPSYREAVYMQCNLCKANRAAQTRYVQIRSGC